ncbi:MAG: hypothetical protein HFACDABA_01580 [Anaerolineales bacterium]|nr:hypothetical protein [Anaerolineales bacterium]
MPGLMAFHPPRKPARGRERDAFIVALALGGNATPPGEEAETLVNDCALAFYNTPGALTSALRLAAETVNRRLLERNLAATGRGQYASGALILAALRENQLTLLQCGPAHAHLARGGQAQHIHDASLSGQEIGLNQNFGQYFSQTVLQPGDRVLFSPMRVLPREWEGALIFDRGLTPIGNTLARLMSAAPDNMSAALIQVMEGRGALTLAQAGPDTDAQAKAEPEQQPPPASSRTEEALAHLSRLPSESPELARLPHLPTVPPLLDATSPAPDTPEFEPQESTPAHFVGRAPQDQPSAYAIPPQSASDDEAAIVDQLADAALLREREFPPSIPRITLLEPDASPPVKKATAAREPLHAAAPRPPSAGTRRAARIAVRLIDAWHTLTARFGAALGRFAPRLLPGADPNSSAGLAGGVGVTVAIAVPLLIATLGMVMYARFGRAATYDSYLAQAQALRAQAERETDPLRQREAWENVIVQLNLAEQHDRTTETIALRQEAQARLDVLLGVKRLTFAPAFTTPLDAEVSRMAASESDLYLLDARQGRILRAALTGRGFELDANFDCAPGPRGNYTIGPMVDVLVLPKLNSLTGTALGVDAAGNLLYCAPGQVAQDLALPPPPTHWGRVTALALDGNKLYALDAPANGVWIYSGKDSVFSDAPLLYFGLQVPDIKDAIDLAVSGDELYLLHADGTLTRCTYNRVRPADTRCDSELPLSHAFPAYGTRNAFAEAHFTQMVFAAPPDIAMLILDADGRSVFRIGLRMFELQSVFGAAGDSIALPGALTAMTVSPNHVLYVAIGGQAYFTNEAP